MRLHSEILVAAALSLVAAGMVIPGTPAVPAANPSAEVRFTNSTTEDATLKANGEDLFTDIDPRTTTEWATVTDSVVTFSLKAPGEGKPPASVQQVIVDGARYTVTATVGGGGDPELSVKQEMPIPAPDSTSR